MLEVALVDSSSGLRCGKSWIALRIASTCSGEHFASSICNALGFIAFAAMMAVKVRGQGEIETKGCAYAV